jgi:hypothetical protein
MSKKDENVPVAGDAGSVRPDDALNSAAALYAIEEHAAALKISAPVFAAVKQANGWAAGKKVEKEEFQKAVDGFLKAPIGGR